MVLLRALSLSVVLTLLTISPAAADPITAAFTATALFLGVSTTTLATALVLTAVGIGAALAMSFAPDFPSITKQGSATPSVGAAIPYQHIVGETLVAGHAVDEHTSGDDNEWYFQSRILSYGPIEDIVEIRFDDIALTFGSPDGANGRAVSTAEYVDNGETVAYVDYGLGDASESVDLMLSNWSNADGNARHQPFAYLNFAIKITSDVFGGQVPKVTVVAKGRKIYDPRDVAQDADDETTWQWSDNPALIAAWLVRQKWGFAALADEVDEAALITAANACDEQVTADDGAENRYRCNGQINEDTSAEETLKAIILSMAGDYLQPKSTGKWVFYAGVYQAPVADVVEGDISHMTYHKYKSLKDKYTKLRGSYVSPANSYEAVDCAPVSSAAALAELGGEEVEQSISMHLVQSHSQARRILSIVLEKTRRQVTLDVNFANLIGAALNAGEVVNLNYPTRGISNSEFIITGNSYEDLDMVFQFQEYDSGIFTAPALVAEPTPPTVNVGQPTFTFPGDGGGSGGGDGGGDGGGPELP